MQRFNARTTLAEAQLAFQEADTHLQSVVLAIENSTDPQRLEAYRRWAVAAKNYSDALMGLSKLL
jgi:hypothetical protein